MRHYIPFFLLFLLVVPGCDRNKTTVGVIDTQSVLKNSSYAITLFGHFEGVKRELQNRLNEYQQTLASYPDQVQAQTALNMWRNSLQEILVKEQQSTLDLFNKTLRSAAAFVREEKSLEAIWEKEKILDYGKAQDITQEIITLVDRQALSLPPLPILPPYPLKVASQQAGLEKNHMAVSGVSSSPLTSSPEKTSKANPPSAPLDTKQVSVSNVAFSYTGTKMLAKLKIANPDVKKRLAGRIALQILTAEGKLIPLTLDENQGFFDIKRWRTMAVPVELGSKEFTKNDRIVCEIRLEDGSLVFRGLYPYK